MDSSTRPPVPPAPPAYSTIKRVTRGRSLRGIVLVCTVLSFIWSIIVGVDYLKAMSRVGLTSRLKTVYLVQGILFLALAGLETIGFWAVWSQQIKAGKLYVFATILGGFLVTATETIRMALHFVFKQDIISACETKYKDDTLDFATDADLTDYCTSDWSNGIWRDAAWLIFGVICSVFMYILSRAYYHQLLDPNFGRVSGAASDRFRLQQLGGAPYGQDPPFVPPYANTGMPNEQSGYAPPPVYNSYDVPAYTPPEKGSQFDLSDTKTATQQSDSRDLESQVEHLSPHNESDDTLPGRRGEGRL